MRKFIVCLCLMLLFPFAKAETAEVRVRVTFLNVGKADAILLYIDDCTYLIDTGTKQSYDRLAEALDGVEELEAVFVTHTDKDHIGGLNKLPKSGIKIKALVTSAFCADEEDGEHPCDKACRRLGIGLTRLKAGDVYELASGCRMEIVSPYVLRDDENDNSLAMRLVTPQGNVFFAGDMEEEAEEILQKSGARDMEACLLKVAHHGRDDATSRWLLEQIRPSVAVISTDREEDARTADPEVIQRLRQAGAKVYITEDYEKGITFDIVNNTPVEVSDELHH